MPHTREPFSGTRWEMRTVAEGEFIFKCLGSVEGNRFLDDGAVLFMCLGHIEGSRFLDGRTGDGTVGLAPHTDAPFSGTRWAIEVPI